MKPFRSIRFIDFDEVQLKLGYKVKLISILDGHQHFTKKTSPTYLSKDLENWLMDLQHKLDKNNFWLEKKKNYLLDQRIFDFQTLFELPKAYLNQVGFDTPGLCLHLALKKKTFNTDEEEPQNSNDGKEPLIENLEDDATSLDQLEDDGTSLDQLYHHHKYKTVPAIKDLFKKGKGYSKAFTYFSINYTKKKVSGKEIENLKEDILQSVIKDIKKEQLKVKEVDPPYKILENGGIALVETFPGLVDYFFPGDFITMEEKKEKVLNYLIRKNAKNVPRGILYEHFYFQN